MFISQSSGAWEVQDHGPADLISGRSPFPGTWMGISSLCPHTAEGAREPSWVPFMKDLIPFMRSLPS